MQRPSAWLSALYACISYHSLPVSNPRLRKCSLLYSLFSSTWSMVRECKGHIYRVCTWCHLFVLDAWEWYANLTCVCVECVCVCVCGVCVECVCVWGGVLLRAHGDDCSSVVIGKVQSLTDLPSTHCQEQCPCPTLLPWGYRGCGLLMLWNIEILQSVLDIIIRLTNIAESAINIIQ